MHSTKLRNSPKPNLNDFPRTEGFERNNKFKPFKKKKKNLFD